jgi:hypothetical protein
MGLEVAYGIGAILLLAALVLGTLRYRRRREGERKVGDQATERLYRGSRDLEA